MAESPRIEHDDDTKSRRAGTEKEINDPLTRTDVEAPRVPFDSQQESEQ